MLHSRLNLRVVSSGARVGGRVEEANGKSDGTVLEGVFWLEVEHRRTNLLALPRRGLQNALET
jgi:hypothetical protein